MSRALANMSQSDRRNAITRRLAKANQLRKQRLPIGLGMLAAIDSELPTFELGFNKDAESRTPRKLSRRQLAWRELERQRGSLSGPGKRYPEGYRMPGSNK